MKEGKHESLSAPLTCSVEPAYICVCMLGFLQTVDFSRKVHTKASAIKKLHTEATQILVWHTNTQQELIM